MPTRIYLSRHGGRAFTKEQLRKRAREIQADIDIAFLQRESPREAELKKAGFEYTTVGEELEDARRWKGQICYCGTCGAEIKSSIGTHRCVGQKGRHGKVTPKD